MKIQKHYFFSGEIIGNLRNKKISGVYVDESLQTPDIVLTRIEDLVLKDSGCECSGIYFTQFHLI